MKKNVIGVDVSKEKLDFCFQVENMFVKEWTLSSTTTAIKASLKTLLKESCRKASEVLVCAEYTGQYTYPLCCACEELGLNLWLENPAQIKHSSGVQRGKNDRLDARRIADYACRFQDKARLFSFPEKNIASLKQLISERDLYIADKSIKSLLHMSALVAATRMKNSELRDYYLRKVAEGKNKMLVLNAVRAKLIARMFAVIKNNQPYQKNYSFSLA